MFKRVHFIEIFIMEEVENNASPVRNGGE